ncbi:MAG: hypothetical protein QXU88_01535 [Candidatus Woesearchaeota archaeon]
MRKGDFETSILELLAKNPEKEFSTTEIVEKLTPGYDEIERLLISSDVERQKQAKRRKAQLHRRILYYLNKLVLEGYIRITKEGKNKEKSFAIVAGVEVPHFDNITVTRPITPPMPVEGYEQKGIIYKLEATTWIDRLNSVLLEASLFKSPKGLWHAINGCFGVVNDVIAVNDFEVMVQKSETQLLAPFVTKLNAKCDDYGKKICYIIDMTNVTKGEPILKLISLLLQQKNRNITFVFDTQLKEFYEHSDFFEKLVQLYSRHNESLYIKNQNCYQAPYFVGKAGPYTFSENEWLLYEKEMQGHIPGLICGQSTIMVDVERFFQNQEKAIEQFKRFVLKIADSLLLANSLQRQRSDELFGSLIALDPSHAKNFFMFGKNYVRFWNYGWKNSQFSIEFLLSYLKESKKAVDDFCIAEDTIYKSCGMPTRFRVAFSCAFDDFVRDIFTKPSYKRYFVRGLSDLYNDELKQVMETKEKLFEVFDGGDMISFYKKGPMQPKDVLREMGFILNTYRLPFFRYSFSGALELNVRLEQFLT